MVKNVIDDGFFFGFFVGVLFFLKDLYLVLKDMIMISGCGLYKDNVGDYNSIFVDCYLNVGFNIFGKINMFEFGLMVIIEL